MCTSDRRTDGRTHPPSPASNASRVSKGTACAASFIVNSDISQARLKAGFLPAPSSPRRLGTAISCSDPSELTGRGRWRGTGEIESIRPLSRPLLCVYFVDKFCRKMTMTMIITKAATAVMLVKNRDRLGRGRRGEDGEPVCVYATRIFWDTGG